MEGDFQKRLLADFVDRWGNIGIKSTGAMLVNYTGVLYNVDGSSSDPQIDGAKWKELLLLNGIDADCYVTNETPAGNSHPNFNVGGHMTPNPDGKVQTGANSYLMPLCSWHNHKARDGVPFVHEESLMLKLSGFMEGEIAATFVARLPSKERHSIIYAAGSELKNADLSEQEADAAVGGSLPDDVLDCHIEQFVLLERVERGDQLAYVVKKSALQE